MLYIYRYLKRLETIQIISQTSLFRKLRLYPIIMIILWAFPIINRFSFIFFGYSGNWTHIIHILCLSLIGIINTLLFALNPKVKKVIEDLKNELLSKKSKVDEEKVIDMQNLQPKLKRASTNLTTLEDDAI